MILRFQGTAFWCTCVTGCKSQTTCRLDMSCELPNDLNPTKGRLRFESNQGIQWSNQSTNQSHQTNPNRHTSTLPNWICNQNPWNQSWQLEKKRCDFIMTWSWYIRFICRFSSKIRNPWVPPGHNPGRYDVRPWQPWQRENSVTWKSCTLASLDGWKDLACFFFFLLFLIWEWFLYDIYLFTYIYIDMYIYIYVCTHIYIYT